MKRLNVVGHTYWNLTILSEWAKRGNSRVMLCRCICGNIKEIRLWMITRWHTKSCGCLISKSIVERSTKHWYTGTRIYHTYRNMVNRCTNRSNPKYMYYWGKWVTVEWKSFTDFISDMLPSYNEHVKIFWEHNTSIDRINSEWNYSKENCRWATRHIQMSNTCRNKLYIFRWEKLHLAEIARKLDMNYNTLWTQISDWKIPF